MPVAHNLNKNQLCIYNLRCTVADIVHLMHPKYLIRCFELFGYTFFLGELLYQSSEHFLCFFVDVGEVIVELAFCQKVEIENPVMALEVSPAALSPYADGSVIALRELEAGEIVIPLQLIANTCFAVCECAFHSVPTFLRVGAICAVFLGFYKSSSCIRYLRSYLYRDTF